LYRGNRTTKLDAENFNAFYSGDYPPLAKVGIHVKYNRHAILQPTESRGLLVHKKLDDRVAILKIYPGISQNVVESILSIEGLQGLILETYGSGNAPSAPWFINALKRAIDNGLIVLNVTQCKAGKVEMGKYEASVELLKAGVISGEDLTTESAVTKLMILLGSITPKSKVAELLQTSLCGEMS